MEQIVNFVPEKYRTLLLAIGVASPYITRAIHALINGGGLKGILSAIWLGTNTPKIKNENPTNPAAV